MKWLAWIVGLAIATAGMLGMAAPESLRDIAAQALTQTGLYVAGALRIAFGIVLIMAAAGARMPRTLRVVGAIFLVGGVVTPFFGLERARALADWWFAQGQQYLRAWSLLATALGIFILYAVGAWRRTPS